MALRANWEYQHPYGYFKNNGAPNYTYIKKTIGIKEWWIVKWHYDNPTTGFAEEERKEAGPFPTLNAAKAAYVILLSSRGET